MAPTFWIGSFGLGLGLRFGLRFRLWLGLRLGLWLGLWLWLGLGLGLRLWLWLGLGFRLWLGFGLGFLISDRRGFWSISIGRFRLSTLFDICFKVSWRNAVIAFAICGSSLLRILLGFGLGLGF